MNILEEIAAKTRVRVAENQQKITLAQMKEQAQALNADTGFPMEQALKAEGISFICEVKKASPSKGLIAEDFRTGRLRQIMKKVVQQRFPC